MYFVLPFYCGRALKKNPGLATSGNSAVFDAAASSVIINHQPSELVTFYY
jgi:hypothetical protein